MDTLPGEKLHLPLVAELGATRSHVARCVTWHSHPGGQLLNALTAGALLLETIRSSKSLA